MSVTALMAVAVQLATTGERGSARAAVATGLTMPSAAGRMSELWKAPLTFRGMTFFAPRAWA